MLYNFAQTLELAYLRAFGAFFTSFVVALVFGKYAIAWLSNKQKEGQPIRDDGPQSHLTSKRGTPTMGGIIIIIPLIVSVLLWARMDSVYIHIIMTMSLLGGAIGFFDDYRKLKKSDSKGLSGKLRLALEAFLGLLLFFWIYFLEPTDFTTTVTIPFIQGFTINLGFWYAVFVMLILASTCNCVNFTDGLDGLAAGCMIFPLICFGIISWFASYLGTSFIMDVSPITDGEEIMVLCFAVVGSLLGFLWYNTYPAKIFMGDTGSLFLGTLLGTLAVVLKQELLLVIIGGIFVIEGLSDIIQILYYKKTKKRIFLMAPLHHHYEKKGLHEVTIVNRFWILSFVFMVIALFSIYSPME